MASENELLIKLTGKSDELQKEFNKISQKTKNLENQLGSVAKKSGIVFAGLAATAGIAVAKFSKFESKFTDVVTLLDKGSFKTKTLAKGIDDLKSGVLKLGSETGQSFDTLNKGLFDLISAGVDAESSIQALTVATNLAEAGATDTSTAVDGLTSAMNAYGLKAKDLQSISEKFFTAQKKGKTTIEELSKGFGIVGASASAFGVSLDELLGAVSAATLGGVRTNAAYAGLKAVLSNIAKPTEDAANEARRLGIEFDSTALRSQGLEKFLNSITSSSAYTDTSLEKLFGSVEALGIAQALTANGSKNFKDVLKDLGDQTTLTANFQEALKVKQEITKKATDKLLRSIEVLAITVGEKLAPYINLAANFLNKLIGIFNGSNSILASFIAKALAIGVALSGIVTASVTAALAFIKIDKAIKILRVTLAAGKIAAAGFWAAMTLGLSLFVSFLPEIIGGLKSLANYIGSKNKPILLDTINKKLEGMIDARKRLLAIENQTPDVKAAIERLDKEIEKYKELKRVREAANSPQVKAEVESENKQKKEESGSDALVNAKIAEVSRIDQIEKDALNRRKIRNAESLNDELEKARERGLSLQEYRLEEAEKEAEFNEELQLLKDEQKAALNLKDIEDLKSQLLTKKDIEKRDAKERLKANVARRNQYLLDEQKYGKTLATLNQALHSEEIMAVSETADKLVSLQQSKNKQMKAIGKAAALVQIGINTATGAIGAYQAMASIPYVGPALGIAAAGALTVYGLERAREVSGFKEGGMVGGVGSGDKQLIAAEAGEVVVPKKVAPTFLDMVASRSDNGETNTAINATVTFELKDNLMDFIEVQSVERQNLNINVRRA